MRNDALVCPYLPNEFHVTLIDEQSLLTRLSAGVRWGWSDLILSAEECKNAPAQFLKGAALALVGRLKSSERWFGFATAILFLFVLGLSVRFIERTVHSQPKPDLFNSTSESIEILSLESRPEQSPHGTGVNGVGRVGINRGRGEGSNQLRQRSSGGGSGGNNAPLPSQVGKVPPPSPVQAAIKKPPLNPSLPAAGIDLDPMLWRDMKLPEYGDPRSKSELASNGPGTGGGVGVHNGTGIGDGSGPGFGSGNNGNTGGGDKQKGCCGPGASNGNSPGSSDRVLTLREVEQRAHLLSKPEPQYTEEARRNQVTGTVILKVIFASSGEVTQIHAVQALPFGLTEKAIAAARQIKFVPATKGGHAVSVWMQLEYNFNLY